MYDIVYRRFRVLRRRRTLGWSLFSGAVVTVLVFVVVTLVPGASKVINTAEDNSSDPDRPSSTIGSSTGPASSECTQADLDRPVPASMPSPIRVTEPIVFPDPGAAPPDPPPAGAIPAPRSGTAWRLDPPLDDETPAVSPEAAWAELRKSMPDRGGGRRELLLGGYSSAAPATVQPDGSLVPVYQGRLVWAVYTHGMATVPRHGPPRPEGAAPSPAASGRVCVFLDGLSAVDAQTGQELFSSAFSIPSTMPPAQPELADRSATPNAFPQSSEDQNEANSAQGIRHRTGGPFLSEEQIVDRVKRELGCVAGDPNFHPEARCDAVVARMFGSYADAYRDYGPPAWHYIGSFGHDREVYLVTAYGRFLFCPKGPSDMPCGFVERHENQVRDATTGDF